MSGARFGGIFMKSFIIALLLLFTVGISSFNADKVSSEGFNPLVYETPEFQTPVCINVNDNYIVSDTPAFLLNGITMVPARVVSTALGCDSISWDEAASTAVINKGGFSVSLTKDRSSALVNGKNVKLDAKSSIYADRFYVPVRFIAETFGCDVLWDKDTYTVEITDENIKVPDNVIGRREYSDDDIYWLSRIINAESAGESMRGKVAVGNVVLNRVESHLYADNIYDVIFDTQYGVQFTPAANGTIYNEPSGDSIVAAKRAFLGEENVGNCLYFLNPRISTNFWIVNNRTFYKTIGNHDFYL